MRKVLLITTTLLMVPISLIAQGAGKTSDTTTVTGCLHYTSRQYILTEKNGTQHQLVGSSRELKPHVGHEVEVTGMEGVQTHSTTVDGAASTVKHVPHLKVTSIKHVADTCGAGAQ